jgi:predicted acetyltransferase
MDVVRPNSSHGKALENMMKEWRTFGGRINPGKLRKYNGNYEEWLEVINEAEQVTEDYNKVPSSTYFLYDGDYLIGAINIRHYLNEDLLQSGGHIAYGIRPSYRGKGYAKKALQAALSICKELKIKDVLLTCDKDNIASAKVIISQGGVLENEFLNEEDKYEQRYWIHLDK